MATHAKFSPSAAHRWLRCPASLTRELKVPRKDTKESSDGTLTHLWAEWCLNNNVTKAKDYVGTSIPWNGTQHTLEEDRAERIQMYLDHIALRRSRNSALHLGVEVKLPCGEAINLENCFGTSDCVIVYPLRGSDVDIEVVDYKDGQEIVTARGNEQMILYAAGAARIALKQGLTVHNVILTIVQPKVQKEPSSVQYTFTDIMSFCYEMEQNAKKCLEPNAPAIPGEKQCKWCAVRGQCPERSALAMKEAQQLFAEADIATSPVTAPDLMTPEQIARVLAVRDLIESALADVAAEALQRMESGKKIPGFKLVRGRSTRKWADGSEASVVKYAENRGLTSADCYTTPSLLSVAQLEKLFTKDQGRGLEEFTTKSPGSIQIAAESDKREAVVVNAAELFQDVSAVNAVNEVSFI